MADTAKTIESDSLDYLDVSLERDGFSRTIIREISGLLQDMIGLEEASGYISIVGQSIGNSINSEYKTALNVDKLSKQQINAVLLDLKRRINGEFYIVEQDENKVVFGNTRCPFEDKVVDRPSLCMMTSNVFGTITAQNTGYSKVILNETIAEGSQSCRVVVYFNENAVADSEDGREYYGDSE